MNGKKKGPRALTASDFYELLRQIEEDEKRYAQQAEWGVSPEAVQEYDALMERIRC